MRALGSGLAAGAMPCRSCAAPTHAWLCPLRSRQVRYHSDTQSLKIAQGVSGTGEGAGSARRRFCGWLSLSGAVPPPPRPARPAPADVAA
jgi:hypothetical protein